MQNKKKVEKKARRSELYSNVIPMLCSCLRRPCYLRGALTCKSTNVFGITTQAFAAFANPLLHLADCGANPDEAEKLHN